ncbi:conjugal transfer protein TrbL [Dermacoccus nishinomiyaensis]
MASVCDIPVISNVCDAVGEGTATLISAPFDWLASSMGGAASWLLEAMWTVFDTTTLVDVTADGYLGVYNLLFGIAVFVVVIFFCLQLITGLIKRDPTALTRAALGAGKSILGSFVVITLTALLLEIVDQLSIGIVQATGETTESMGDKIMLLAAALGTLNIAAPGVGAIVGIFLAAMMIAAIGIVWFSLLIRKALILVAVVLAPLALSGSAWDAARGWVGKWAMFVLALIISKLVLVVVFLIAITQLATPIDADLTAVTEPISGIVLLFIAAFAPYMVYRFISFLGFDLYNSMGTEQEAKNAMNRPLPVPAAPGGSGPKKVLDDDGGDGKPPSGGGGGDGGPPPPPSGGAAPAAEGGAGAGAGSGAGVSGGAAGGGAAAAAGPAVVAVVAAEAAKAAADAGPALGEEVGGQAEDAASHADNNGSNPGGNDGGSGGGPNGGAGGDESAPAPPSDPVPNSPSDPPPPPDEKPPAEGKE